MNGRPSGEKTKPLALIACKAIMRSRVSSAAKAVAAELLDHVNWSDPGKRCDPSVERIAWRTGRSRSTVQSGLDQLQKDGVLVVHVHGGLFGRNQYDFSWDEILRRDAVAQSTRKTGPPRPGNRGVGSPDSRAQTRSDNPKIEPVATTNLDDIGKRHDPIGEREKGIIRAKKGKIAPSRSPPEKNFDLTQHATAALAAAERRWNHDLLGCLSSDPVLYGTFVDAIDMEINEAATKAEMGHRGDGIEYLLEQLRHLVPTERLRY